MIKFNERFSAERDALGWTLTEKKAGKNKDGGHVIRESETYYTSFQGVCSSVIDRSIGVCESLPEVLAALKDINKFITSPKAGAIATLSELESSDD